MISMKRLLYWMALIICLSSCVENQGVYFFYEKTSKDTIVSIKFLKEGTFVGYPKVRIVLKNSIYSKDSIENLFYNTDFLSLLKSEKQTFLCDFFLYKEKGGFSNYCLYNDSNYYLKGHLIFLEDKRPRLSLLFENFYLRDRIKEMELREREFEDSIKRDSVMTEFSKKKVKLSFMGHKLGGSYTKSKGLSVANIIVEKKILNEDIDDVEIQHQGDVIYGIDIVLKNYQDGFTSYDVNAILDLYREKYGENYGGYEWRFNNSGIKITTESREYEIKAPENVYDAKGNVAFQIPAVKEDRIYKILIEYYDNEAFSLSSSRVEKEWNNKYIQELKEIKVKEHQQLLEDI